MVIAYVLINCKIGFEDSIIKELKSMSHVKDVHATYGAYDMLAKIESWSVHDLTETITSQIRKMDGVNSTLTLMGIEELK